MRKILSLILLIMMIFTSSSIFGKEKGIWTHKKINNHIINDNKHINVCSAGSWERYRESPSATMLILIIMII